MAAPEGGAPQLSELESLQLKANQITDESLDSTRRMIALCEEVSLLRNWLSKLTVFPKFPLIFKKILFLAR